MDIESDSQTIDSFLLYVKFICSLCYSSVWQNQYIAGAGTVLAAGKSFLCNTICNNNNNTQTFI